MVSGQRVIYVIGQTPSRPLPEKISITAEGWLNRRPPGRRKGTRGTK